MNLLKILLFKILCLTFSTRSIDCACASEFTTTASPIVQFSEFKTKYDIVFNSGQDEVKAFQTFANNLDTIAVANSLAAQGLQSFTLGVNEFATLVLSLDKRGIYVYFLWYLCSSKWAKYE